MRRISIDPITRLEGHGRIEIFLNDEGDVENAYLQVPELRGFERFCVGRPAEDMPVITNRICGICPEAHHLAACKALDELFMVTPPRPAKLLREILYSAFFVTDHTTHFYALGAPDFILGPDAPPSERNLLGVIHRLGMDLGKEVLSTRKRNHEVIQLLGGRGIHPAAGLPGGWSKSISEATRKIVENTAHANIQFAQVTLGIFDKMVLNNPTFHELLRSDIYLHRTYAMGMVDDANRVNFYDGKIRIVDPDGNEFAKYPARDYREHIAERVETWSYMKFPYLKSIGWKGFVDGIESGVYCASPLSRLNVSDSMATPLAQQEFLRFYETLGGKTIHPRQAPVHHRLATHWARLIELLYASERMLELSLDPEITSSHIRNIPSGQINPMGGIGCVEAPRGTLTHHFEADEKGMITKVNLVVGTTNNHASMAMSIRRAAEKFIQKGKVDQGLLNRVEMAFRLYDPCLSCATHHLPGETPMIVNIRDAQGEIVEVLRRD